MGCCYMASFSLLALTAWPCISIIQKYRQKGGFQIYVQILIFTQFSTFILTKIIFFFFFRLARQFTNCEDVVVTEDAFHGNLGVLIDISPKMHQYVPNYKPKDFVHVSPLPSSYRLSDILSDLETPSDLSGEKLDQWIAAKCAEKVEAIFVEAKKKGRGIAGFICEPCFVSSKNVLKHR